jgi:hypothetical protein
VSDLPVIRCAQEGFGLRRPNERSAARWGGGSQLGVLPMRGWQKAFPRPLNDEVGESLREPLFFPQYEIFFTSALGEGVATRLTGKLTVRPKVEFPQGASLPRPSPFPGRGCPPMPGGFRGKSPAPHHGQGVGAGKGFE